MARLPVVNVGYDSTNYYVVVGERASLLVDVGFPGTLPRLRHHCARMDVRLESITHLLCTHYHPDHAGLAQEIKDAGVTLIVLDCQRPAISQLRTMVKPGDPYRDITFNDIIDLKASESRVLLARLGIAGEIVATPGHSDDSVSLVLDQGAAFTGDLTHPLLVDPAEADTVAASWRELRARNVTTVYPGHGPAWTVAQLFPHNNP